MDPQLVAEDAVQQAFLIAWRELPKLRDTASAQRRAALDRWAFRETRRVACGALPNPTRAN
jgi:DNA-directed RNA polymerase specialized sigma24 family protein